MLRQWAELLVGIWILISPWIFGFSGITIMMWSNVLAGLVIILSNVWVIFGEGHPKGTPSGQDQKGRI